MVAEMLVPEYLLDVPPAAKLVYLVLEDADGRISAQQVAEETGLSRSAVTQSVDRLQDAGVHVEETRDLGDLRYTAYELPEGGASR
jgi:biotin operon repressor